MSPTAVCAPRQPMSTPSTNSTTNSEVPSPPSASGTDSNTIGSTTGPGRDDLSPSTPQPARRSWMRAVYEFWRHLPTSSFSGRSPPEAEPRTTVPAYPCRRGSNCPVGGGLVLVGLDELCPDCLERLQSRRDSSLDAAVHDMLVLRTGHVRLVLVASVEIVSPDKRAVRADIEPITTNEDPVLASVEQQRRRLSEARRDQHSVDRHLGDGVVAVGCVDGEITRQRRRPCADLGERIVDCRCSLEQVDLRPRGYGRSTVHR